MNADRQRWTDLGVIFALAVALRLGFALTLPADDSIFWDQPYRIYAQNYAAGRGFWMPNPYDDPSLGFDRVYAFRPPLFPFLWGCAYNATTGAYAPVRICFAILGAATCALAYLLAMELIRRRPVALIGGLFCALYPPLIWHSVHLMTEPMFIFLSLATLYALTRLAATGAWRWVIVGGAVAGLATLTRSVMAGFLPVMAFWVWWVAGRGRRAWAMAAFFTGVVTLAMLPWIVRNAAVFHAFVPTTTDAGHGFYVANNSRSLADPRGFFIPTDWSFVKTSSDEKLDELEMNRRLVRAAREYLWTHPAEAAQLMARRFVTLWRFYPNPEFVSRTHVLIYALCYMPLFPLMLIGLWRLHRDAGAALPAVLLADALILYTTVIHTLILAMLRYREPLMPILLPCAALGLITLWEKLRRKDPSSA